MPHPELALFFLVIAFIYASVGFGGGSSYLAILALYAFPFEEMRLIALICNIIVVTGGTLVFFKKGQVNLKKVLPLVVASVPMAFVGASLKISQQVFFIVLGCSLVIASVLLWMDTRKMKGVSAYDKMSGASPLRDALLGGGIGFLSGMVGIGGGIFLSPLLNLLKWDNPRKVAATASLFILVNSLSGVAGQLRQLPPAIPFFEVLLLAMSVLIGGQLGSRLSVMKFNQGVIRRITAVVVLVAGIEVLYKHLS